MITFDGLSGAGKSTQSKLVREAFNIPRIRHTLYKQIKHPNHYHSISWVWRLMVSIEDVLVDAKGLFVMDWCFEELVRYIADNNHRDYKTFDPVIESVYMTVLDSYRNPPLLSYWLSMPAITRETRLAKRESKPIPDEIEYEWEEDLLDAANYLSSKWDFFRVLDVDRPINEIFSEVKGDIRIALKEKESLPENPYCLPEE